MTRQEAIQRAEYVGRTLMTQDFGRIYFLLFTTGKTDTVDFFGTATTRQSNTYVGDVKCYANPDFPRTFSQYPDYMIDYQKLQAICDEAAKDGRTPILVAYFADCTCVWDLSAFDWTKGNDWRWVNKYGVSYGAEKEYQHMAYLHKEDLKYYEEIDNLTRAQQIA